MVHTTAGYMVYTAYTFKNVFNYEENDIFCCTADIGWITGHSYILYGPLLNGATTVIFEGYLRILILVVLGNYRET
jgi:acetyl-CoA synthetase